MLQKHGTKTSYQTMITFPRFVLVTKVEDGGEEPSWSSCAVGSFHSKRVRGVSVEHQAKQ